MKSVKQNKGFSLLELSIVLTIIGLLTAGVFSYKKIQDRYYLNNILAEINQLRYAIGSFDTQYQAWPGDFSRAATFIPGCSDAGANTCNGNGNGEIGDGFDTRFEGYRVWQHLSLAGIYPGGFNGGTDLSAGVHPALTESVSGPSPKIGGVFVMANLPRYGDFMFLRNTTNEGLLTPDQLYFMDEKIDDGNPMTGRVQGEPPPLLGTDPADCRDEGANEYNFSQEDAACILIYSLGCEGSCNQVASYLYEYHD